MKEFFKKVWERFKKFFVWLFKQLKDKKNIIIFIITSIILSSEVWFSYLMAIVTGNKWWWAVGSACWAFWLAPFTPFFALSIAITVGVRKIFDKITEKKRKNASCDNADKTNETAVKIKTEDKNTKSKGE